MTERQTAFHPWRRLAVRLLVLGIVVAGGWLAIGAVLGRLYAGPASLTQVVGVMPGVPVFPCATVASSNRRTQRLMAVPLYLLRRQGMRVEAAVLAAPGEHADVSDWYRRAAPGMGWTLVGDDARGGKPRLVFLRGAEGLQLTIGDTVDHLYTPVQYVFLTGLPTAAMPDLLAAAPTPPGVDTARLTTPRPTPEVAPAPQPVATETPREPRRTVTRRRPPRSEAPAPVVEEPAPPPASPPEPAPAPPELHKPVVEHP